MSISSTANHPPLPPGWAGLLIAVAAGISGLQAAGGNEVVLPPEARRDPIVLRDAAPGTHFVATGLKLLGGTSTHYQPAPRFALLGDRDRDPEAGVGYHDTAVLESWQLPLGERYPIQLRDLRDPSISGFSVMGVQARELPWRVMKAMWDGDALHVKGCTGTARVSDVYWENVEDGFGPTGEGLERWSLHRAYMRYIRDDAVENDDLLPGEIVDCLIDGCFVFLSQRGRPGATSGAVTRIRGCVVHVQAQPHDGVEGRAWRDRNIEVGEDGVGRAPGMLFKWDSGAGSVSVEDCVFRMDQPSFNGPADMVFPPGRYENVTLVWTGAGDYPQTLPEGVTLSRDPEVWRRARAAWIARLPASHPAREALGPAADR